MISPATAHRMRKLAASAPQGVEAAASNRADASAYELLLYKLAEDRRRLKDIQSIARKIEVKRQILPDYAPWIEGVLQADAGGADEVFVTVLCWRIDAGDYTGAVPLADYALRHKLPLPDRFARTLACLIAEEFAENALKGEPVPLECLQQIEQLTEAEDMPDEVRAKLHKAIGQTVRETEPAHALYWYSQALKLHERCGVKKDIEKLERELKKNAGEPATVSPN